DPQVGELSVSRLQTLSDQCTNRACTPEGRASSSLSFRSIRPAITKMTSSGCTSSLRVKASYSLSSTESHIWWCVSLYLEKYRWIFASHGSRTRSRIGASVYQGQKFAQMEGREKLLSI